MHSWLAPNPSIPAARSHRPSLSFFPPPLFPLFSLLFPSFPLRPLCAGAPCVVSPGQTKGRDLILLSSLANEPLYQQRKRVRSRSLRASLQRTSLASISDTLACTSVDFGYQFGLSPKRAGSRKPRSTLEVRRCNPSRPFKEPCTFSSAQHCRTLTDLQPVLLGEEEQEEGRTKG